MSWDRNSAVAIHGLQIRDAGDSGILLELEPVIDLTVNARAIAIASAVTERRLSGVRDVIPTYRSVAVHFDPMTCDVTRLREALLEAAATPPLSAHGSVVEVPVSYGGGNGPDLDEVARFASVSPQAVIERHSGGDYHVFMLGFLPGFAYMGSVDDSIAAPRKATPRTRIPAGSVGIAGRQTGVYPCESPGGWQLIGRTALQVFDAAREPAALFAPGDRVRFIPVNDEPRTLEPRTLEPLLLSPAGRALTVIKPGLFTTIQDAGRWGYQDRGVPVSGPMDRNAYRLANALVGNPPDAAALEVTLLGPELRFESRARVAVTGADLNGSLDERAAGIDRMHDVSGGTVLRFGERRAGTRAYVAVDGGIDVPAVLGSRSTHVLSRLGGIAGRSLRAGDRVPLGTDQPRREPSILTAHTSVAAHVHGGARVRVLRGPQDYYFGESTFTWLAGTRFTVSSRSDRMGYRLVPGDSERSPVSGSEVAAGSMISDATFVGAIQIPPSGEPIVLMADRQTTGGYPQIATIITADLPVAGQLAPGDWIEFIACSREEALAALKEQDEAFRAG